MQGPGYPVGQEEDGRGAGQGSREPPQGRQGGDPRMMGVVLAGGEGKRLKPPTQTRPKPMLPVAGRPCIDYVLRSMIGAGMDKILITTAYLSEYVIKQIGDGLEDDASLVYSFEDTPAGGGGGARRGPG